MSSKESFGKGGAIAMFGGSLTMDKSTLNRNSAALSGGGLYVDPALVKEHSDERQD